MTPLQWTALSLGGVAAVWPAAVATVYETDPDADEVHYATTRDGLRLALSRYRPPSATPSLATPRRRPVMIVPGLAANRFGFDLTAESSFARHLRGLGFDTYVAELRGAGLSESPSPRTWNVDTHLELDLPALIAQVLAVSGADSLHWVGHSMGGMFAYALLATRPELPVRSCAVIGASLDYSRSDSDFRAVVKALPLADYLAWLPLGALSRLGAPFAARSPRGSVLDRFNVWPPNVDRALYRRLSAVAFDGVPTDLLVQLATAITGGGLRAASGGVNYYDALPAFQKPLLSVCGDHDRQSPIASAEDTFDRAGSAQKSLLRLGPEHGTKEHYGHWDMVIGLRAPNEVWPKIVDFLATHD